MVSTAEVLCRAKRAPSLEDDLPPPSSPPQFSGRWLPTTLWPSVPSWNNNESSLLSNWWTVYEIAIKAWLSSIKAKYKELAICWTIFVEVLYSTPCIVYNRQTDVSKLKECDWVPCLLWILHAWDQWANIWQTDCVIKKNHHSVWSRYLHFTQFVHSHDWRKPISKYNNISYLIVCFWEGIKISF